MFGLIRQYVSHKPTGQQFWYFIGAYEFGSKLDNPMVLLYNETDRYTYYVPQKTFQEEFELGEVVFP
jgi:hypothetical protein